MYVAEQTGGKVWPEGSSVFFFLYNLSLNACVNNCSSYQIYHKDVQMSGFTFIIKTDIDSHKSGLSNSGGENSGM